MIQDRFFSYGFGFEMDMSVVEFLAAIGVASITIFSLYTYQKYKFNNAQNRIMNNQEISENKHNDIIKDSSSDSENILNLQISPYKRELLSKIEHLYDKFGISLENMVEKKLEYDVSNNVHNIKLTVSGRTYEMYYYLTFNPDFFRHGVTQNWRAEIVNDLKGGIMSFVANLNQLHQSYGNQIPGMQLEYSNDSKKSGGLGVGFIEYINSNRDFFEGYLITDYFADKDFRISWAVGEHLNDIFEVIKGHTDIIENIKINTHYLLDANRLNQIFEELEERKIAKQLIYFSILLQDRVLMDEVYRKALNNFKYKTFRRHS